MGDGNLFRVKKAYFAELGIKAFPYYLDFQGYDRLLFVLRSWIEEIKVSRARHYYDNITVLDEVLSNAE
jgi:hypothetical protein